jgi:hypothetical protein
MFNPLLHVVSMKIGDAQILLHLLTRGFGGIQIRPQEIFRHMRAIRLLEVEAARGNTRRVTLPGSPSQ